MNKKLIILFFLFVIGCKSPVEPPGKAINKDIVELKKPELDRFGDDNIYGKIAIYRNGNIYSVYGYYGVLSCKIKIDQNNNVTSFEKLDFGEGHWTYIDGNESGTKLLLVNSILDGNSAGSLFEYNTVTKELTKLINSTNYVSSARYLKGDDTKLIYYKYGKINYVNEFVPIDYTEAGYYLLDLTTKEEKLVFSYVSGMGIVEMINCFDIHPSNTKLLISLTQGTGFHMDSPLIGIYDIETQKLDTLNIVFEDTMGRMNLWLRYNKAATKILYSYFPHNSYGHVTNGTSEAGIIDVATLNRKILDLNTYDRYPYGSVQLSVEWDDNEQRIVFCSGRVSIDGLLGSSKLYILKQIP